MISSNMQNSGDTSESATLLAALSTLPPPTLSSMSAALSGAFRYHHHRISTVVSSPTIFSTTLHHLYSLSLPQKSLLITKYLLYNLQLLTPFLLQQSSPPPAAPSIRLRDLDSILLLLLFCEFRHHNPKALETTSPDEWRRLLAEYHCHTIFSPSATKEFQQVSPSKVMHSLVDVVAKCRRFVGSMGGCEARAGRQVAASVAAVVALPSVEVEGGAVECVICKEEMAKGRDVCMLPCQHMFHWMCVLRWLRKRNTCPCCRQRLPSDDVFAEIERLWEVVARAAKQHLRASD